jgi:carbamoyltransferase
VAPVKAYGTGPTVTFIKRTVERDVNPLYWNLIREFDRLKNVPVVMNLLFRLRGEPIVGCSTDTVLTFYSSGLDALVIGSFVVEK